MTVTATLAARARSLAADDRAVFVVVNVGTNVLFLVRSFVTMQLLDYRELGLAALLQSIILLLSMLQFGFFQGGYRLMCSMQGDEARRINNLIYTFMAALSAVAVVAGGAVLLTVSGPGFTLIGIAGIVGGAATLCKSWMTNQLIARQDLRRLNSATLLSALMSMAMFSLVPVDPFLACVLAVVTAPIVFVAMVARAVPATRPDGWEVSVPLARRVLSVGFVVFLTGVFLQANVQLERWYVAGTLGLDALGHLYLAILYMTVFQLVPASFDAIFLPKLVQAHDAGDELAVGAQLRTMFLVVGGYTALAVAVTLVLAGPVIGLVLPKYLGDLPYVYWLLPGLALFTLTQPFAMIFNVLIRYRSYFIAYGGSTVLTALAFGLTTASGHVLDLTGVIMVRSGAYLFITVAIVAGFILVSRDHPAFRFSLNRTRP